MTWLERDTSPERSAWLGRATERAVERWNRAKLDVPDPAFVALIDQARMAVARSSAAAIADDNARLGKMDAWEYRELLAGKPRRFITADNDQIILAALIATLDLIPPKT